MQGPVNYFKEFGPDSKSKEKQLDCQRGKWHDQKCVPGSSFGLLSKKKGLRRTRNKCGKIKDYWREKGQD